MDAELPKTEKICRLVQRLHEVLADVSSEPLHWNTVQELTADYPGWSAFVQSLRYPNRNTFSWAMHNTHPLAFSEYPSLAEAKALFAVFEPYGILLDPVLDKSQKVERLEACIVYNETAAFFWEDALENPDPEIHTHALGLLNWIEANRSLLRGADAPQNPSDQLLRAAKPTDTNAENLLRSGETPEQSPPKPAGFWARLFRRLTGVSQF